MVIFSRIIRYDRINRKEMLKKIGLENYNVYEIAYKTRAVLVEDYFWCKYEESDTYDEFRIR